MTHANIILVYNPNIYYNFRRNKITVSERTRHKVQRVRLKKFKGLFHNV